MDPYHSFGAATLITAFQVLLSNHFCILPAVWSPCASLIQLQDCYKKLCLKSRYMTSAAVLLPTKPVSFSQEEIILFWHNVLLRNPWWLLLKSCFLLGACCTVFNYLFQFVFSFPRISCCFYFIFPFRRGAKTKSCEFGGVNTDNTHPMCDYCLR